MEVEITPELVSQLVADQFPQWADLPVRPVDQQGWDNRTFRLGDALSVRLPSADGYVAGLQREEGTLRLLHARSHLILPHVIAAGVPSTLFPRPWSVRRWIPGTPLAQLAHDRRPAAISATGAALAQLHRTDTTAGPWCGATSAFRGCHPSVYAQDVQQALIRVEPSLRARLASLWLDATATVWAEAPRWVHGDLAPGNILLPDGDGPAALIDLGQTCVGDPATDLSFGWLACTPAERGLFAEPIDLGSPAWRRGAAWALWKTLISTDQDLTTRGCRPRDAILNDLATSA